MIHKETMVYIESEYSIIHETPCEFCGKDFKIEDMSVEFIEGTPHHFCYCTCNNCGNEKMFVFLAPYFKKEELIQYTVNGLLN
ncbi:metal-binding protein [Hathewaya histolytica]|uniref:metal-binding protein n=1 Tax=Hathewaya histolytica TaxID=1498 RepID=UPI003B682E69